MTSIDVPDIGTVEIRTSRQAKRVILRISSEGTPRITIPAGTPKFLAKRFAIQHKDWILKHTSSQRPQVISNGLQVGRTHTILFQPGEKLQSRVSTDLIKIYMPSGLTIKNAEVQKEARKAATRAVRRQAEQYLPKRLYQIAREYCYEFKEVRCKALKTRWGSCSSEKIINLNIWLMQLPDELVDYVLVHELVHLNHPNHQKDFWDEVSSIIPSYKQHRKALKSHNPALSALA